MNFILNFEISKVYKNKKNCTARSGQLFAAEDELIESYRVEKGSGVE
jgi:hypothetical protein